VNEQLSIRIVREAIDRGINFMDNCWDYNDGTSEIRMGKALRDGYRSKVFLMTKIDGRSKKEAARQLEESLRRLQTDCIDLVQHHEILRYEDPHRIFDEDGANAALGEARKAGKLRYIGFTGHKDPRIHLYMLEVAKQHGFKFDTVQMPLNVMDAHYRSFEKLALPELVKAKNRRARDEEYGQRNYSKIEYSDRDRVPSLCAELTDIRWSSPVLIAWKFSIRLWRRRVRFAR
jgi:aryl-alcohol dehydrogenase-like predicted oxidoreductase